MGCNCSKGKGSTATAAARAASGGTTYEVLQNGVVKYRTHDKAAAESKKAALPGATIRTRG
ncbi:hypothetical protein [Amycolatopsis thermophila]|uniref:Uncharacterized protein n=1 Tax=Amycolatopsis thermophila TaxID=206084 RepID=A0ABU0EMJ0_9PSEU|nr:hypothetical protein [Amycolatopsis thermophila]MDQ0376501.1 hypothetical protein [Amycolatopsis thermophila]